MLFAAGLGTRLYPITKDKPKALVEINGKTLLQRNIEYLLSYGITEIVVNVHHFAPLIISEIEKNKGFGATIFFSDERDEVLETGGGLMKAKDFFKTDFLAMNVDILTDLHLSDFIEFHSNKSPLASLAITDRESSRKLLFDDKTQLKGWKNLKTEEEIKISDQALLEYAFSGIHIISPDFFELVTQKGKFSIIQPYLELMEKQTILGFDHSGDLLLDVGKKEALTKAEKLFP